MHCSFVCWNVFHQLHLIVWNYNLCIFSIQYSIYSQSVSHVKSKEDRRAELVMWRLHQGLMHFHCGILFVYEQCLLILYSLSTSINLMCFDVSVLQQRDIELVPVILASRDQEVMNCGSLTSVIEPFCGRNQSMFIKHSFMSNRWKFLILCVRRIQYLKRFQYKIIYVVRETRFKIWTTLK